MIEQVKCPICNKSSIRTRYYDSDDILQTQDWCCRECGFKFNIDYSRINITIELTPDFTIKKLLLILKNHSTIKKLGLKVK